MTVTKGNVVIQSFIIEKNTEGLSLAEEEKKLGIKGSSTRQVFFENAKVPAENVLGEIGMETQELLKRITIDPEICHGKPCIRGLRYPVEVILELLSSDMGYDEILMDYEDLEYEDILASLAFATRLSQVKRLETVLA